MTIKVDTDLMQAMASSAASARLELEDCAGAMARIVEHQDWCCAERDTINQYIAELRRQVQKFAEDMEQFSGALRGAANDFSAMEQSIPAMFQEINVMLGRLGAISPSGPETSNSVTAGIARRAAEGSSGRMGSYTAASLTEDIRVCRFSDFAPRN